MPKLEQSGCVADLCLQSDLASHTQFLLMADHLLALAALHQVSVESSAAAFTALVCVYNN